MSDTSHLSVTAATRAPGLQTRISTPPRGEEPGATTAADVPRAEGGTNSAPSPTQMLLGALAACKTMTAQMYAARKSWPLDEARVNVRYDESTSPPQLIADVELAGDLTDEQRERVLTVIEKCHVQQIIHAGPRVVSQLRPVSEHAAD
ncbi:MAG: OsmC family protein [Planctomycetota bacterium]